MGVRLIRSYHFAASHLYQRPDWTEAENRLRFGACARPPGHGHNYRLTIGVDGEVDSQVGFVMDLVQLDRLVKEAILDRVDHRHLNDAIPEFAPGREIPSTENLCLWIRSELSAVLPGELRLARVSIFESDDLGAEWSAEAPSV